MKFICYDDGILLIGRLMLCTNWTWKPYFQRDETGWDFCFCWLGIGWMYRRGAA